MGDTGSQEAPPPSYTSVMGASETAEGGTAAARGAGGARQPQQPASLLPGARWGAVRGWLGSAAKTAQAVTHKAVEEASRTATKVGTAAQPWATRAAEEAKRAYAKTSDLAKEGATRANTAARDWNGTTMARLRDFGRRLNLSRDGDADEAVSQAELEWYSINLPALELARGTTYGALREFPLDLLGLGAPAGAADVAAGDVAALLEGAAFSEGAGPAEREAAARAALAARLTPWQQRHAQLILLHAPELRHFHDSIVADLPAFEVPFWLVYLHLARHVLPGDQSLPLFPRDAVPPATAPGPGAGPAEAPGQVSVAPGEHSVDPTRVVPGGAGAAGREEAHPGLGGFLRDVGGSVKAFGADVGGAFGLRGGAARPGALGAQIKTGLGAAAREARQAAGHLKEGLASMTRDASAAVQGLGAGRARRDSQDSEELDLLLEEEMAKMRGMQAPGAGTRPLAKMGKERGATDFDDVLSGVAPFTSVAVDGEDDGSTFPASAHASWQPGDGDEDGGKGRAGRAGRRGSLMRTLSRGIGSIVQRLSSALGGLSRSNSKLPEDGIGAGAAGAADPAPKRKSRFASGADAASSAPLPPAAPSRATPAPAADPATPPPCPVAAMGLSQDKAALPHDYLAPAQWVDPQVAADLARAAERAPEGAVERADSGAVRRVIRDATGETLEPPPLDSWDSREFRSRHSSLALEARGSPDPGDGVGSGTARLNPAGAVHQAPRGRGAGAVGDGAGPGHREPGGGSDELWMYKQDNPRALEREGAGGSMDVSYFMGFSFGRGGLRQAGATPSDASSAGSIVGELEDVSMAAGLSGALRETDLIAQADPQRERALYARQETMTPGQAEVARGPTLRDIKEAGFENTYNKLLEVGKAQRAQHRRNGSASQVPSTLGASTLGASTVDHGDAASVATASPLRSTGGWSRARTKVSSFLTVASSRFRQTKQQLLSSLEDIYEEEDGSTAHSKFAGQAYQMAMEASVNAEAHEQLMRLTMAERRRAREDKLDRWLGQMAREDAALKNKYSAMLLQQEVEGMAATVIQTYARRWLAGRACRRRRVNAHVEAQVAAAEATRREAARAAEREVEQCRRVAAQAEKARLAEMVKERERLAQLRHLKRAKGRAAVADVDADLRSAEAQVREKVDQVIAGATFEEPALHDSRAPRRSSGGRPSQRHLNAPRRPAQSATGSEGAKALALQPAPRRLGRKRSISFAAGEDAEEAACLASSGQPASPPPALPSIGAPRSVPRRPAGVADALMVSGPTARGHLPALSPGVGGGRGRQPAKAPSALTAAELTKRRQLAWSHTGFGLLPQAAPPSKGTSRSSLSPVPPSRGASNPLLGVQTGRLTPGRSPQPSPEVTDRGLIWELTGPDAARPGEARSGAAAVAPDPPRGAARGASGATDGGPTGPSPDAERAGVAVLEALNTARAPGVSYTSASAKTLSPLAAAVSSSQTVLLGSGASRRSTLSGASRGSRPSRRDMFGAMLDGGVGFGSATARAGRAARESDRGGAPGM